MSSLPPTPPGDNNRRSRRRGAPTAPVSAQAWERLSPASQRFLASQGVPVAADQVHAGVPSSSTPSAPSSPSSTPAPSSASSASSPSSRRSSSSASPGRQWHRQGRKPSRRERNAQRRQAVERRERAYLDRLTLRMKAAGFHGVGIRLIPLYVWVACAQVVADATGRAARLHLRQLGNRTAAGAILAAAMPEGSGRTWASLRTRRIAALGLALALLAKRTGGNGRWRGIVRGVPRGALAALLRDPFDTRAAAIPRDVCARQRNGKNPDAHSCQHCRAPGIPSITTIFGTHRPGAPAAGDAGYFASLRRAGVAYRQQLPADQVSDYEVGPTGHALNRYWVASDTPTTIANPEARARAWELQELAERDARRLAAELLRSREGDGDKPPDKPPPE